MTQEQYLNTISKRLCLLILPNCQDCLRFAVTQTDSCLGSNLAKALWAEKATSTTVYTNLLLTQTLSLQHLPGLSISMALVFSFMCKQWFDLWDSSYLWPCTDPRACAGSTARIHKERKFLNYNPALPQALWVSTCSLCTPSDSNRANFWTLSGVPTFLQVSNHSSDKQHFSPRHY